MTKALFDSFEKSLEIFLFKQFKMGKIRQNYGKVHRNTQYKQQTRGQYHKKKLKNTNNTKSFATDSPIFPIFH